jgi:hypothetical protein
MQKIFKCHGIVGHIYVHMTSCTLPTCDISLGLLIVAMPEAEDSVEALQPFPWKLPNSA